MGNEILPFYAKNRKFNSANYTSPGTSKLPCVGFSSEREARGVGRDLATLEGPSIAIGEGGTFTGRGEVADDPDVEPKLELELEEDISTFGNALGPVAGRVELVKRNGGRL
ncbi:UNVERIFIED_CONTAM: hypothetical protein Slati_2916200 [Sesamum latifolium]|uniref:Uncharacterized protein n=1 Tax=Sesamum latifolium TaxID=2727402 RepID=A0AAW2VCY6_9LAMI